MPKPGKVITKPVDPKKSCKACGGTGKNSKGGQCVPCVRQGRIK